jgi:hypothetical protein
MRELERRLQALEQSELNGGKLRLCFVRPEETTAEAIARTWPQGLPPRVEVTAVSWMPTTGDSCDQKARENS